MALHKFLGRTQEPCLGPGRGRGGSTLGYQLGILKLGHSFSSAYLLKYSKHSPGIVQVRDVEY